MNNNPPTLNRSTGNVFGQNATFNNNPLGNNQQPNNNIFGNNNTQNANTSNNLFSNLNNANQNTGNIFNNPNNQTQNNMFNNQQNQNPQNIFTQQPIGQNQPQNNIFGQQAQNQPQNNIFGQQNQNQSTTIFGQQTQNQPQNNMFTPGFQNQTTGNIFAGNQNQTTGGNLFNQTNTVGNPNPGGFLNNNLQSGNLFGPNQQINQNLNNPQQNYGTSLSQLQITENYIKAEKKGNFQRLMAFYLQTLMLSQTNEIRNQKFRNIRFENSIVNQPNNPQNANLVNSVNENVHKKFIAIVQQRVQQLLADAKNKLHLKNIYNNDIDKINQNASKKLKFYKQAFLQIKSPSNIIKQIEDSLKYLQQLVQVQIKTYYVAHQSKRYSIYIKYPTNFQMKFTQNILKQVKIIIEKLKQYEICQQVIEPTDVSEVIGSLIEYYKNLTCLVYDFKQKYGEVKQKYLRTIKSTSVSAIQRQIKNKRDQQLKNKESIFKQLDEVEKTLKKKIERRNETKKLDARMI